MRCRSPDTIGTHTHCQPLHAWDQTSCDVGRQVAMETLLSLLMSSALLLTFGTDQLLLGHAETPVDQREWMSIFLCFSQVVRRFKHLHYFNTTNGQVVVTQRYPRGLFVPAYSHHTLCRHSWLPLGS